MKDIKAIPNVELLALLKEMYRIDKAYDNGRGIKDRRMAEWSGLLTTTFNNHIYKDYKTGEMREGSWIRTWTNIEAFMEKELLKRVITGKIKVE